MDDQGDRLALINDKVENFVRNSCKSSQLISQFIYKDLKQTILDLFDNSVTSFIDELTNKRSQKQVYFIRHAESEYNAWRKKNPILNWPSRYQNKESNRDPSITKKGVKQCQNLVAKLSNSNDKSLVPNNIDLVYVSPLKRAIQTFENIKEGLNYGGKVVVSHLIMERLHTASDIGTPLDQLKQSYHELQIGQLQNEYDFSLISKQKYWEHYQEQEDQQYQLIKESDKKIKQRLFLVLVLIMTDYKYNRVVLVSHSQLYRCLRDYDSMVSIFSRIGNTEVKRISQKLVLEFLKYVLNRSDL